MIKDKQDKSPEAESQSDDSQKQTSPETAEETKTVSSDPSTELDALKKELAENKDRYLRVLADMENLRKRHLREKDELRQFATSRILEDMLPILDNLGFATSGAKNSQAVSVQSVVEGVNMIVEQIKKTLASHGLQEINPLNQAFDPNLHEAVSHIPDPKVPADYIINVTRIGYMLNGRLLRPASVVVSSGPQQN